MSAWAGTATAGFAFWKNPLGVVAALPSLQRGPAAYGDITEGKKT